MPIWYTGCSSLRQHPALERLPRGGRDLADGQADSWASVLAQMALAGPLPGVPCVVSGSRHPG